MYKRTYNININLDPYELDPNLDFALTDIIRRKIWNDHSHSK